MRGDLGAGLQSCLMTMTLGNSPPPSEPPFPWVSNGDKDLCLALLEDKDVVGDPALQTDGAAFFPTTKLQCPGQPWPAPQDQSPVQPAGCLGVGAGGELGLSPLEGRSAQPGGSERASVSLGCASQQAPFPHAPVPPLRPAGLGEQTGPIGRPRLQFLGMGCALQLSFPGAGAKQAAPRCLAGLQAFCAEFLSSSRKTDFIGAGRNPATSLCLLRPGYKTGAW